VGKALHSLFDSSFPVACSTAQPVRAWSAQGRRILSALLAGFLAGLAGCHSGLPKVQSAQYTQFVQTFYVGLAAMEVGNDVRAESSFAQATQLAPGEPAAWADWGILALRQRNFDQAKQRLDRAHSLLPHNGPIDADLGTLESTRGNSAAAIADFREAVRRDPGNVRALYQLALEIERQGGQGSEAEFQQLIEQILAARPDNLPALLELSRIAAKRGDTSTLRSAVDRIAAQSAGWPPMAQQQFVLLKSAAATAPATAALRSVFLRNVLMQVPSFRQSLAVIRAQPGEEAQPFQDFLRLPSPSSQPAPADMAIRFVPEPLPDAQKQKWGWIGAVLLDDTQVPTVITANAATVNLMAGPSFPFPGGPDRTPPGPDSIVPMDFNYDFKTDLVLAGAGGVRFLRQDSPQKFTDVTAQTKLPGSVINGNYTGAWALDIEADGDLDVALGSPGGVPSVLRNNGDGTFTPIQPWLGISGIQQLVWADLDNDGVPDVALLDGAGNLHVLHNERSGHFRELAVPGLSGPVKAIAAADTRHSGRLDLLVVRRDGSIMRLADDNATWTAATIAHVPDTANALTGSVRLLAADLDNNGAVDLLLTHASGGGQGQGALIWMGNQDGSYTPLDHPSASERVFAAADVDNTGHLDLLGLDADGSPAKGVNHGTKNYPWQVIRTRAVTCCRRRPSPVPQNTSASASGPKPTWRAFCGPTASSTRSSRCTTISRCSRNRGSRVRVRTFSPGTAKRCVL
jgi:Tfp pilus assembly protein PilF